MSSSISPEVSGGARRYSSIVGMTLTAAPSLEEAKELLLDALLEYLRSLGDDAVVEAGEPLAEGTLQISLSA